MKQYSCPLLPLSLSLSLSPPPPPPSLSLSLGKMEGWDRIWTCTEGICCQKYTQPHVPYPSQKALQESLRHARSERVHRHNKDTELEVSDCVCVCVCVCVCFNCESTPRLLFCRCLVFITLISFAACTF